MKAASISEIKHELKNVPTLKLLELNLRLARFKKENKELLTYLLFESQDENAYILSIREEMITEFQSINTKSYYLIKKSIRRILKRIKTYARYSGKVETEVELLISFCENLKSMKPTYRNNIALSNLYNRQIIRIESLLPKLHEDLQYDYKLLIEEL